MKPTDIVAYAFQADIYHPVCVLWPLEGDRDPWVSVETQLDRIAERKGIDRQNEHSFDSNDFPKVIFTSQIEDDKACGHCGESLLD